MGLGESGKQNRTSVRRSSNRLTEAASENGMTELSENHREDVHPSVARERSIAFLSSYWQSENRLQHVPVGDSS